MKKRLLTIAFLSTIIICYFSLSSNQNGKKGVSTTGCTNCHGTSAKTATTVSVTFDGATMTSYTPGQKYQVTIKLTHTTYLNSPNNSGFDATFSKGTLSNNPSGVAISTLEIYHTTPKAMSSGTSSWTFDWTAPASGSGAVTINVAGMVANGNGTDDSNDAWNKTTVTLSEASTASTPPTISNLSATNITTTTATINAKVNANNAATTVLKVEYGLTSSYGSSMNLTPSSVSGNTLTSVLANLTGLTANKLYHYRIVSTNGSGTTNSVDSTFTTKSTNSISNTHKEENLTVYPNPAKHYIFLDTKDILEIESIYAINLLGQKINLNYTQEASKIKMNVMDLSMGKYYLSIHTKDGYINTYHFEISE